jgi:hypothetical protein
MSLYKNGLLIFFACAVVACSQVIMPTWERVRTDPSQATNDAFYPKKIHYPTEMPSDCSVPEAYMTPPLMVLGDSLSNGVQALHVNRFLSEWSFPNLIAIRAGAILEENGDRTGDREFFSPDYPGEPTTPGRPGALPTVGIAFEKESFLDLLDYGSILKNMYYNIDSKAKRKDGNGRIYVENLGAFGISTVEGSRWTADDYEFVSKKMLERKDYTGAITYRNAAFVLNPKKENCLKNKTAIDQIVERKPKSVIISLIGNNGLFNMAFRLKKPDDIVCSQKEIRFYEDIKLDLSKSVCKSVSDGKNMTVNDFANRRFIADMRFMLNRINLEGNTQNVYVMGMLNPGRTANVKFEDGKAKGVFGGGDMKISEFEKNVEIINNTNRELAALIQDLDLENRLNGRATRFWYLDVDGFMASKYDYKGCVFRGQANCERFQYKVTYRQKDGTSCNRRFDNRAFKLMDTSSAEFGETKYCHDDAALGSRYEGGLFSLDNMHLSSVGYALLADFVADYMQDKANDPIFTEVRGKTDRCEGDKRYQAGSCIDYLTAPTAVISDANRAKGEPLRYLDERAYDKVSLIRAIMRLTQ